MRLFALAVTLTLSAWPVAAQQKSAAARPWAATVDYDKFKDQTLVACCSRDGGKNYMRIGSRLQFAAFAIYEGRKLQKPLLDPVRLAFISTDDDFWKFKSHSLILLIDGDRVEIGEVDPIFRSKSYELDRRDFLRLLTAKSVEGQLDFEFAPDIEFQLTSGQIAAFKHLYRAMFPTGMDPPPIPTIASKTELLRTLKSGMSLDDVIAVTGSMPDHISHSIIDGTNYLDWIYSRLGITVRIGYVDNRVVEAFPTGRH